jgi:hypothetical protein
VWAGDGSISGNNSTIKVCSLAGTLLTTITTGGNSRAGRGCFDPVHQRVLFANDMERNFQHQTSYPFLTILNASTYAKTGTITLDPTTLGTAPSSVSTAGYATGTVTLKTAATSGVGSCVYNPATSTFWVAIPECFNQTAQNAYLTTFIFPTVGGVTPQVQTANAGSGGDPNADHGCVLEINPTGTGKTAVVAVHDVGDATAFSTTVPSTVPGPNPGATTGTCTTATFSKTAIPGVCGATYKDVCVAPLGIALGPNGQVLLGCFANGQTVPSPESTGGPPGGANYKASVSNCSGTGYPAITNATYMASMTYTNVTFKGTSATLGNSNAPCMNPDFPTAVLDNSGALYNVVTQMAGADLVAVDNGSCFDKTSCGQTGGVTRNDDLEGSFGIHYFLASAAYHANGTASSMCTAATNGACTDAAHTVTTAVPVPTLSTTSCGGTSQPACTGIILPTGFVTNSYTCGNANSLPGIQTGTSASQIPGPGLLNSINADYLPGTGTEIDPTPAPGPNMSPINNPAAINIASAGGQVPGWHTQGCSPNTSLIGSHSPSHSVAVDLVTNQVYLAAPGGEVGTAQTNGMVTGQFSGWQTSSSVASLIPIDPQYPPSATGPCNDGSVPNQPPCIGQQAVPSIWDGFTRLCGTGIDNLGNTGSDTNGCILVLQDGP